MAKKLELSHVSTNGCVSTYADLHEMLLLCAHTHAHAAQSDGTVPSQEPLIPLV